MKVSIRPATLADIDGVLDLIEELFERPGAPPPAYDRRDADGRVRACVESRDADALLAVDGMEPVGLATVYVDLASIRYGRRCWLEDLVVTAGRRREGVGRQLLDAAALWAKRRACTHLELDSGLGRADAHRFYLDAGMSQDGYTFGLRLTGD